MLAAAAFLARLAAAEPPAPAALPAPSALGATMPEAAAPATSPTPAPAPSATVAAPPPAAASAPMAPAPLTATALAPAPLSSTAIAPVAAPSATAYAAPGPKAPAPAKPVTPAPGPSASVAEINATFDELHKRASIVMLPSAFAAHVKRPTGENVEVFFSWYIGTFYTRSEQRDGKIVAGPDIRAIFTMFIGADAKWAFLQERKRRPAAAFGYFGGFAIPFAGGPVRASEIAKQKQAQAAGKPAPPTLEQTFMNDVYLALSKTIGPVAVTLGGMYGIKKAIPLLFPMLRNPGTSALENQASPTPWLAFGGVDVSHRRQHVKIEVATLPESLEKLGIAGRPWLVQTHIDSFLGFDLAFVKDPIGYEVVGYYLLPFMRWPDKKRLEKETERMKAARTGAISAP